MNKFIHFINQQSERYKPEIAEVQAKTQNLISNSTIQTATHAVALFTAIMLSPLAAAAGFEDEAKGMADKIYKGIYAFVGVVALIVVLWQCVEGWSGRKSWMDVLSTCLWVVAAAASGALVAWLWQKGSSMTFN